jgi:hypothetical protein
MKATQHYNSSPTFVATPSAPALFAPARIWNPGRKHVIFNQVYRLVRRQGRNSVPDARKSGMEPTARQCAMTGHEIRAGTQKGHDRKKGRKVVR